MAENTKKATWPQLFKASDDFDGAMKPMWVGGKRKTGQARQADRGKAQDGKMASSSKGKREALVYRALTRARNAHNQQRHGRIATVVHVRAQDGKMASSPKGKREALVYRLQPTKASSQNSRRSAHGQKKT